MKAFHLTLIFISVLVGFIGYAYLMGYVYARIIPFQSDIPAWLFAAVPTGGILGGISAYASISYFTKDYVPASLSCIFTSVPIAYFYFGWYRADLQMWSQKNYAIAETGPALLWSISIFIFGCLLMAKFLKARRHHLREK